MSKVTINIFKIINWNMVSFTIIFVLAITAVCSLTCLRLSKPKEKIPEPQLYSYSPSPTSTAEPEELEPLPEVKPQSSDSYKPYKDSTTKSYEMPYRDRLDFLQAKSSSYLRWVSKVNDKQGWVGPKCNGLFYTSLLAALGESYVKVDLGEDTENRGKWFSDRAHECFLNKKSKSTIDERNLLGLLFWILQKKELKKIEDLIVYGELHDWKMGEAENQELLWSEVTVKDNLKSTIFLIRDYVAGVVPSGKDEWRMYDTSSSGRKAFNEGFEIMMRIIAKKQVSGEDIAWFKEQQRKNPKNPFYLAVYDNITNAKENRAVDLTLDESIFPSHSLPSQSNRCADFVLDLDNNDLGLKPCPRKGKRHSGVDLTLANFLITTKLP